MVEALSYKQRTLVINIDGTSEVFCDNQLVAKNLIIQNYTLSKRHNSIYYHRVSVDQSGEIIWVG